MSITTNIKLPPFHPFVRMDIPTLMRRSAEQNADRPLLLWEPFEGEPRRWTYAEAWADVLKMASGLQERGVSKGDAVILHLENSPESILVWLACAVLGAVAVTTNVRSAGDEFAYFIAKSNAVGVVTQASFEPMVKDNLPPDIWLAVTEPGDTSLHGKGPVEVCSHGPEHPLSIQFTSGTTARPKAVLWTHANGLWGAMVNARHLGIRPDDVSLVTNPLFHTMPLAFQVLGSIWVGASVVVQPKFSASRFWSVAVRNRCTWGTMGFFAANALAGYPVPEKHFFRFNVLGQSLPSPAQFFGIRCMGLHAMTETITQSILNDPAGVLDEQSMGRPAPEYDIRLMRDDGEHASFGEQGELQVKGVRGLSLFAEYFGDPDATAEAFTPDGYFCTGDIVTLREDGALVFADRKKDMLKVGGENVAASEIERAIRAATGVRDVAVVAQRHTMLSEVPFAFVIPQPGSVDGLVERIDAVCQELLADFKRPRGVRFVEDFPRGVGGKIVKFELRKLLEDGQGQ